MLLENLFVPSNIFLGFIVVGGNNSWRQGESFGQLHVCNGLVSDQ